MKKSYLQNQYDNEALAYNDYINKPNQVIYIALLHNQIIGFIVLKKELESLCLHRRYNSR